VGDSNIGDHFFPYGEMIEFQTTTGIIEVLGVGRPDTDSWSLIGHLTEKVHQSVVWDRVNRQRVCDPHSHTCP